MSYYFAMSMEASFEEAVERAKQALMDKGFGVLTEIDVQDTLRRKLGVEFRRYRILGACNPKLAHAALTHEDKIGTMLPCNVIVQELRDGLCEIAAVDPVASMQAIDNKDLVPVATAVRAKLAGVIDELKAASQP